jgi:hypothetical protein
MVKEKFLVRMGQSYRATFQKVKCQGWQKYSSLMVTCMKVNGKITKRMDLGFTSTIRVQFMKDTGRKICNPVSGLRSGWITANMKDPT